MLWKLICGNLVLRFADALTIETAAFLLPYAFCRLQQKTTVESVLKRPNFNGDSGNQVFMVFPF